MSINEITIAGNLGQGPTEVRNLNNGDKVCCLGRYERDLERQRR